MGKLANVVQIGSRAIALLVAWLTTADGPPPRRFYRLVEFLKVVTGGVRRSEQAAGDVLTLHN